MVSSLQYKEDTECQAKTVFPLFRSTLYLLAEVQSFSSGKYVTTIFFFPLSIHVFDGHTMVWLVVQYYLNSLSVI